MVGVTGCDAAALLSALRAAGETVIAHRDELVELDRAIGDGDHGENLKRGFTAFDTAAETTDAATPGAVLKLLAKTLMSTVGGAAGPLYGTAFLRAGTALGDAPAVDTTLAAAALRASAEGIRTRGKAELGDKTMLDALEPAVAAASDRTEDLAAVLGAAAAAADQGAEDTRDLVARKGRASYLGERSAGHIDPGARSTALLLSALATCAGSSQTGAASST